MIGPEPCSEVCGAIRLDDPLPSPPELTVAAQPSPRVSNRFKTAKYASSFKSCHGLLKSAALVAAPTLLA
jgi:hypothetical protein